MNNTDIIGVVVDAGHGGNDPGAINGNIYEKDFTLQAANYIYNRLNELGIPAVMTRDNDVSLPKNDRIRKVSQISPSDPRVILVSNHINSGGSDISNYEGLILKKYIINLYKHFITINFD